MKGGGIDFNSRTGNRITRELGMESVCGEKGGGGEMRL